MTNAKSSLFEQNTLPNQVDTEDSKNDNNTDIVVSSVPSSKSLEMVNQKEEKKATRVMEILKENLSCEMYHAILDIFDTDHFIIKIHLVISLLLFYSFASYTTVTLIMSYFEYGTTTLVSTIVETPSTFPKITICNLNQFTTQFAYDFIRTMDKINPFSLFNASQMEQVNLWYKGIWLAWPIYFSASGFLANKTDDFKMKMGHSLKDTLIRCQFNFLECTFEDFVWSYDNYYGNCYTFNSGFLANGSKIDLKQQYVPGYSYGLQLDFYSNFYENLSYFNSILGGRGALIRIDNLTHVVDHNLEGIYVSTGQLTNLAMRREIKTSLAQPYSDCLIDEGKNSVYDSYLFNKIKASPYDYTQSFCLQQCLQELVINKCKCRFTIMTSVMDANVCSNITQVK